MKKILTTLSILLIATAGYCQGKIYTETELKIQLPIGEAYSAESSKTYTVERVIDGDTIVVTTPDGKSEKVRLIGIDAPPIVFPEGIDPTLYDPPGEVLEEARKWGNDLGVVTKMGQEATEFVKDLGPPNPTVRLEYDVQVQDKYKRTLAYVYYLLPWKENATYPKCYEMDSKTNALFVNATIIKCGYATPITIPPNMKYVDLFKELYEEAREEGRGFWAKEENRKCTFENPCTNMPFLVVPEGE